LRSVFAFVSFCTLLPTAPVDWLCDVAAAELSLVDGVAGVVADVLPEGGDAGSLDGVWLYVCCATATPMALAVAMVAAADARNFVVSMFMSP